MCVDVASHPEGKLGERLDPPLEQGLSDCSCQGKDLWHYHISERVTSLAH